MSDDLVINRDQPIFWTSTRPGYNDPDRIKVRHLDADGEPVRERLPQNGHVGDWDARRILPNRSIEIVRDSGDTVHVPMTQAAGDTDTNGPYAQYLRAKFRTLGWFAIGMCPITAVASGTLMRKHVRCAHILTDQPCERGTYSANKPCRHALEERDARNGVYVKAAIKKAAEFKDPGEKQLAATQDQTQAMVSLMTTMAEKMAPGAPAPGFSADDVAKMVADAVAKALADRDLKPAKPVEVKPK